jgi:hypothetical protein
MNLSQKNNNPVNLRYKGQRESIGKGEKDFALFSTPMAGWRAAHSQIALDITRGLTIREFIFKFAPPSENNTNAYLDFVCKELNVAPEEELSYVSKYALAGVMAKIEGYYDKPSETVEA